jgi:putative chitinase
VTVQITLPQLAKLAPSARSSYREAFPSALSILDRYEITATPLRVAHYMAQVLHESSGLTIQFENLNYSPERLSKVWPGRFMPQGTLDPSEYAHNPEKLANLVYGNRMGNSDPDDGFKYRGRGLLQLTGKDSYREVTKILRSYNSTAPDLVSDPDQVISASWCVEVATAVWRSKGCNELADKDQIRSVTKKINGGLVGLAEREEWLKRTKNIWL